MLKYHIFYDKINKKGGERIFMKKKILLGIIIAVIVFLVVMICIKQNKGETVSATHENYKLEMVVPDNWFVDNENEVLQRREYQVGFVKTENDIGRWSTASNNVSVILKSFDIYDNKEEVIDSLEHYSEDIPIYTREEFEHVQTEFPE